MSCFSNTSQCYISGPATGSGEAFIGVLYDAEMGASSLGDTDDVYILATVGEVGATWGTAYQPNSNSFYTGATIKRHAALTATGTGVIFKVPATVDEMTGLRNDVPSTLINLNGATFGVGGVVNTGLDPRILNPITSSVNADPDAFATVGKIGIGDVEVTTNGNTMYAMNLNGDFLTSFPELVEVDVSDESSVSVTTTYPLNTSAIGNTTDNISCVDGELRPWAIEIHPTTGEVYVGCVCTAENTTPPDPPYYEVQGSTFPAFINRITSKEAALDIEQAKLKGYVLKLDKSTGQYSNVLEFDLDGNRSNTTLGFFADWQPWTDDYPIDITTPKQLTVTGVSFTVKFPSFDGFPQPIVGDIEFLADGDLLISMMDRWGLQTGSGNALEPDGTADENGRPAGDVLRFDNTGSDTWTNTPSQAFGDAMSTLENAAALGGIAYQDGTDEFIGVSVDPTQQNSNGLSVIQFDPSTSVEDVQLLVSGDLGDKGLALGDVEIGILNEMPIYDLAIIIRTPMGQYNVGDPVDFPIEIYNQGSEPVSDIKVTNYLPPSLDPTVTTITATVTSSTGAMRTVNVVRSGNDYVIDFGDMEANWLQPDDVITFDIPYLITMGDAMDNLNDGILNTVEISMFDNDNNMMTAMPIDQDSTPDPVNGMDPGESPENNNDENDNIIDNTRGDEDDHDIARILAINVLPVELLYFEAKADIDHIDLTWASEVLPIHWTGKGVE